MSWLKLVRWKNLLIMLLTQLLAWYCVIRPIGRYPGVQLLLNFQNFLLVALSTVLIGAAGYIINDYFDIRIDNINRPEKMVLEKTVPRRLGIILHTTLNVVALLCAAVVARKGGHYSWIGLQLTCTLLLWFYSTHFKRQFVTGNVVVALLTALTIVVLVLYEPGLYGYVNIIPFILTPEHTRIPNPVWVLAVYAFFAFVLTWMREIVKDMEDFKGDEAEGCMTMPIRWGLKRSTRFVQALGIVALLPLCIAACRLLLKNDYLLGLYTAIGLIIPIIIWIFSLQRKHTTEHYANASRWLKIIMISGIGSLIIYYLEANG